LDTDTNRISWWCFVIKVSVKIKNSKKYLGIGNSKKEAEQKAALKLLDTFKK